MKNIEKVNPIIEKYFDIWLNWRQESWENASSFRVWRIENNIDLIALTGLDKKTIEEHIGYLYGETIN